MPYIGNIVQDFSVNTAMLNTDSVTSIKIDDGTIVNADINDSAAIAGTKISPNFGSQDITTTGNFGAASVSITDNSPSLIFNDSAADSDFRIRVQSGVFKIRDDDNTANRLEINSSGVVTIPGHVDINSGLDVEGATTFNESGADVDFRVEGDTDTHLLVVDASTDRVAIGVNPSSQAFAGKFHVKLSTDKHIIFNDGQGEVGNVPCIVPINDSSVVTDLGFRANHLNFAAGTGSQSLAQKMTIDNTGVAIGQGNIDAAAFFHIRCGSDKNIHYSGGIGEIGSVAGFQTVNDAANTLTGFGIRASEMNFAIGSDNVLRLHTDGNIGMGTTSPLKKLHLVAPGDVALMLQTTNANNDAEIWEVSCGANASSNADLIFRTRLNDGSGGDERVRMTQGGNLEVSGSQLKVQNTGNCNVLVGSTNASGAAIVLDGDSDGNGSGADYAYIEHDSAGNLNIVQDNPAAGGKIDFFTAGAARVSMQSDKFRPANNEGMTLGTSGLRWGNVYTSGILFGGDTAVANTLDDYEEGTWTASISSGTVNNIGTQSGRSFKYKKIGGLVTFNFDFFKSDNTMEIDGNFVIDGLPFATYPDQFHSHLSISTYQSNGGSFLIKNYIDNNGNIVIHDNGTISNIRHFWGQGFFYTT